MLWGRDGEVEDFGKAGKAKDAENGLFIFSRDWKDRGSFALSGGPRMQVTLGLIFRMKFLRVPTSKFPPSPSLFLTVNGACHFPSSDH